MQYRRMLKNYPQANAMGHPEYPMTGRIRMRSFLELKLHCPLGAEGYACMAMTATVDGATAHYAYAYWRNGASAEPEYICVSPTYDSRDGEYRRRFTQWREFATKYEEKSATLAPFEEAVNRAVAEGTLQLDARVYPETAAAKIVEEAQRARALQRALAVALALDLWNVQQGLAQAHTNKAYQQIMKIFAEKEGHLLARSRMVATPTDEYYDTFVRVADDSTAPQCGQKLVPLSLKEAMQAGDPAFAAWREIEVTRRVGDLVINFITPSFAIYNQWAYIEGSGAALYENASMGERYARGRVAATAVDALRDARQRLAAGAQELGHSMATDEMDAHIYEGIDYAQQALLMAPVALLHTMEDVGWGLQSIGQYARRAVDGMLPAIKDAYATPDMAARHIFEYAYAAHCLHTKIGVVHADIHPNNMTSYVWGMSVEVKGTGAPAREDAAAQISMAAYYSDPFVAYVLGPRGEADTFLFPASGDSACLIDYSRAILGPAYRERLEAGRSPQQAANFYRDQVGRVVRAFHRYAPAYVEKHQEAIRAAALANLKAAFPILAAIDYIAIGRSIATVLEAELAVPADEGVRQYHVAHEAVQLARELERAALAHLIAGLQELVTSPRGEVPAFPGETLLRTIFGAWLYPAWVGREKLRMRDMQLVDMYNYNNALEYSGTDYAKYPPWARLDVIERHLGALKLTDLFAGGVGPFLAALRPGARVELVAEELRRAQEVLDGQPVEIATSWIE
jgi:hypothetical protein